MKGLTSNLHLLTLRLSLVALVALTFLLVPTVPVEAAPCNLNLNRPLINSLQVINGEHTWETWASVYMGPAGCGAGKVYEIYRGERYETSPGSWTSWRNYWRATVVGPLGWSGTYYGSRVLTYCTQYPYKFQIRTVVKDELGNYWYGDTLTICF